MAPYVPPHRRGARSNSIDSSSSNSSSSSLVSSTTSSSSSWRTSSTPSPPSTPPQTKLVGACWRATARPISSSRLTGFKDVKVGQVLHLPATIPPASSIIHQDLAYQPSQSPWNHPAVVIGKWIDTAGMECINFRLCTSFSGRDVVDCKPQHLQGLFMLADNDIDTTPQSGVCLAKVEPGSDRFKKRTYINLSRNSKYSIEYKYLDQWSSQIQFDQLSMKRVLSA